MHGQGYPDWDGNGDGTGTGRDGPELQDGLRTVTAGWEHGITLRFYNDTVSTGTALFVK